jgi:hypothetical protein
MEKETYQKELLKTRKGNKEDKRQIIRKTMEKSSRLLDNYYNPKIHKNYWKPSGTFHEKREVLSNDIINYNDSKINSINESKSQIHFLEFDYMENNDIIIIIEHCSNCEEHLIHTQHINHIYKNYSKLLQKSISLRFPFIKIYLKPIEDTSSRLGAFEIQLGMKFYDNVQIIPLFSKLNTGNWPTINYILNKISNYVPIFNLKCILFDKEMGFEADDNLNSKNDHLLLDSKFENIKINLYSLYNEQIEYNCLEAADSLEIIFNPKRRTIALLEENQNSQMLNPNNNNNSNLSRPLTTKTNRSNISYSNNNNLSSNSSRISNNNLSNKLSFLNNNSIYQNFKNDIIEDLNIVKSLKGKLLSSGYTDKEGVLIFENVPFDSYLLEVESSKNFLSCGFIVQFNQIYSVLRTNNPKENYTLNKIIGIRKQIDSYLEIFIYSNCNNDGLDMELISDAKVTLKRKLNDEEIYSGNEETFQLNENPNVKGRYDIVIPPGNIEIKVFKEGYNTITKNLEIKSGENKINIELQ